MAVLADDVSGPSSESGQNQAWRVLLRPDEVRYPLGNIEPSASTSQYQAWRSILPPPDVMAASAVTSSVNAFAVDLYQVAGTEPGNLVISPLSAMIVLALTYLGARGPTAQQLSDAMYLPADPQQVADGFREITRRLQSNEGEGVLLCLANRMYLQSGFGVKDSFRQTAVGSFRSGVEELDFADDSEGARVAINDWVAQNTEGKITDLFQEGMVTPDTALVLVNALYFSAPWTNVFDEALTEISPFYVTASQTVDVPTMNGTFRMGYGEVPELDATAVRLLYEDTNIPSEMIIFLPKMIDGLENIESNLALLDVWNIQFEEREVSISLPRFKIETTQEMSEELKKLSIIDLFGPQANLTGISDNGLFVSQVIQKSYIKVNENSTEAAAATGVGIATLSSLMPAVFKADHPFFYLLRRDDLILFMGRVTEPTE